MKKLLTLMVVVCGLSIGCKPATPPADTGAGADTTAADGSGTTDDHADADGEDTDAAE